MRTLALSITALALAAGAAHADPAGQRVYAGVGMDTTVVTKLGYERDVVALTPRLTLTIPAEVTLPVLAPDGGDGELRAGLRAELRPGPRYRVDATLLPFARATRNDVFRGVGLGVDLALRPTVLVGRGAVGLELGYDRSLAEHLRHTRSYRDLVYADVVDGWYQGGAATLRAGLHGELALGRASLRLRTGVTVTEGGNRELVPFYGELGVAVML